MNLKSVLILLSFIVCINLQAQDQAIEVEEPPPPPPPPQEVVEEIEDVSSYRSKKTGRYETARLFDEYELYYSRYTSSSERRYGVMKKGKVILPMVFKANRYQTHSAPNVVLGLGKAYGIYNLAEEKWQVPMNYKSISYLNKNIFIADKNGFQGLIDESNNIIGDFKWSRVRAISGLENYVQVTNASRPNRLSGIFSILSGELVIPAVYKSISKLNESNLFKVTNSQNEHNIIDIKGREKFKERYTQLYVTRGGRNLFIAKKGERMGVINADEKVIVPFEYLMIKTSPYQDGSYLAQNMDGKFGCMTIEGKVTLPFKYDDMQLQGYNSVGISNQGGKCGIVQFNNGSPTEIATCDYDDIVRSNKFFLVEQGGKFAIMDFYGNKKTDFVYDEFMPLRDQFIIARKKKKWALISTSGEEISDASYDEMAIIADLQSHSSYSYQPKFTYLKMKDKNGKYGIIDKLGTTVLKGTFEDIVGESQNVLVAKQKGKMGLYNILTKKAILPFEYDQLSFDNNGYFGIKGKEIYQIKGRHNLTITKL